MKFTQYPPLLFDGPIGRCGIALSFDGRWLVTTRGSAVDIYDLHNPAKPDLAESCEQKNIGYPTFAPDGMLFCGHKSFDFNTFKWKRRFLPKGPSSRHLNDMIWLDDGRFVLSSGCVEVGVYSPDGDSYSLDVISESKDPGRDARMTASPDGTAVAVGGGDWVFVFDTKTGKYLKRLPKKKVYGLLCPVWGEEGLFYVDEHPDSLPLPGREIVRITLAERLGKKKFADLRHFDVHENVSVTGLMLGAGGAHLYATYTGNVHGSEALRAMLRDGDVESKERLNDVLEESLARSSQHVLVVWDVASGESLHVEALGQVSSVNDYAISGDQKRIAFAGHHNIVIVDVHE